MSDKLMVLILVIVLGLIALVNKKADDKYNANIAKFTLVCTEMGGIVDTPYIGKDYPDPRCLDSASIINIDKALLNAL